MMSRSKTLMQLSLTLGLCAFSTAAFADDGAKKNRKPFTPSNTAQTHELKPESYYQTYTLTRVRTHGKDSVSFRADARPVTPGAIMLVEIDSVQGKQRHTRYQCVATVDIAECLGAPVKLRYLPGDDKVVLQVTMMPKPVQNGLAVAPGRNVDAHNPTFHRLTSLLLPSFLLPRPITPRSTRRTRSNAFLTSAASVAARSWSSRSVSSTILDMADSTKRCAFRSLGITQGHEEHVDTATVRSPVIDGGRGQIHAKIDASNIRDRSVRNGDSISYRRVLFFLSRTPTTFSTTDEQKKNQRHRNDGHLHEHDEVKAESNPAQNSSSTRETATSPVQTPCQPRARRFDPDRRRYRPRWASRFRARPWRARLARPPGRRQGRRSRWRGRSWPRRDQVARRFRCPASR